jgi:uncharacterized protein YyaL (SSP411 family)
MLREISSRFQPHSVVLLADSRSRETLARWNEAVRGMQTINGKTAAYVCENFTCQLPVTEVAELVGLLQ